MLLPLKVMSQLADSESTRHRQSNAKLTVTLDKFVICSAINNAASYKGCM